MTGNISTAPVTLNGSLSVTGDNTFSNFSWTDTPPALNETLSGIGTTTIPAGGTFNVTGLFPKTISSRTVANAGTMTVGVQLDAESHAVVNNLSTGTFDLQNNQWLFSQSGATFNNAGLFKKSTGTGEAIVTSSWTFNNTGIVKVQSGTLSLEGGGTHTGVFDVSAGAVLNFSGLSDTFNPGTTFSGAGAINLADSETFNGVTFNNTGPITLSGTMFSNGDLALPKTFNWTSGTMSGAGKTTIPVGNTLNLSLSSTASATLAGRTLENAGTINFSQTSASPRWVLNGATISNLAGATFNSSGAVGFDNYIVGSSGVNAFNNFGTLNKTAGNSLAISVPFNNAGLVQIQQGTVQFNGLFTQSTSTGRIVLAGGNLYSPGTLAIQAGSLEGNGAVVGNVQLNGSLLPGPSAGTLTFIGGLALQSGATTAVELSSSTSGGYDRVNVVGPLILGGTLQISLISNFHPSLGDSFDIFDGNTVAGTFASLQLPTLNGQIVWDTTQLNSKGVLSVASTFYAGDFNRDGKVNDADIPAMLAALSDLKNYEATNTLSDANLLAIGDLDGSGTITNSDLQALIGLLKSGVGSVDPVPEPASVALLAFGLAVMCCYRLRAQVRSICKYAAKLGLGALQG